MSQRLGVYVARNERKVCYNFFMVKLNRPHIGIFGRMNVGKSSLINAISGQESALVSNVAGTTTDPVRKNIEILGIGPVTLIDTAGWDDTSELGRQRVAKTREILNQVDLAILVYADEVGMPEKDLTDIFRAQKIPFFIVHNKTDLFPNNLQNFAGAEVVPYFKGSPDNSELLAAIIRHLPQSAYGHDDLFGKFVRASDEVVLVTPIDSSAPEGRLILPQVQVLRGLLDVHAAAVVLQPQELAGWLKNHTPKLVITDSQAFQEVSTIVPRSIPLTSFSILFSRLKGDFDLFLRDTPKIDALQNGDRVLILESCTHTVNQCDDIGRVKIPHWLQQKTGKELHFEVLSNLDPLPADLSKYKLAVQCGGCMVTRVQILARISQLSGAGIPVSNYGMTIAYCNGIFERVTEIFRRDA